MKMRRTSAGVSLPGRGQRLAHHRDQPFGDGKHGIAPVFAGRVEIETPVAPVAVAQGTQPEEQSPGTEPK